MYVRSAKEYDTSKSVYMMYVNMIWRFFFVFINDIYREYIYKIKVMNYTERAIKVLKAKSLSERYI